MNTYTQLLFMPLVGAFIGWTTNLLAVKLIFKPYNPIKLPLLPFTIQGIVPKRRAELAVSIGQVVERELLSGEDIMQQLRSPQMVDKLLQSVKQAIDDLINEKIPHWVPPALKNLLIQVAFEAVDKTMPLLVERSMEQVSNEFRENIQVAFLVKKRLNSYPIEDIERIIVSVAARELKHIEILGGVLGFMVGLLQFLLLQLFA